MSSKGLLSYMQALALAVACLAFAAPAAQAADTYTFDALLSLTGDCSVSTADPVPDPPTPDCAAGPHPPSGPFTTPRGTAIDSYGNRYVASFGKTSAPGTEGRIDVFDPSGEFLTELALPKGPRAIAVDSDGVLYVAEYVIAVSGHNRISRYEPQVYKPEAGEITYPSSGEIVAEESDPLKTLPGNQGMTVDPGNDHLFVDYDNRIAEFGSAEEENPVLDATIGEGLLRKSRFVAVDRSRGKLYASHLDEATNTSQVRVFELEDPHALLTTIEGLEPGKPFKTEVGQLQLAVDEATGHLFVGDIPEANRVIEFDEDYDYVSTIEHSFVDANQSAIAVDNSSSPRQGYLFVNSGFNGIGHSYAFAPIEVIEPPEVESVSFAEVTETEAELRATINPMGAETKYRFEYVDQAQFEEEGFAGATIAGEGQLPAGSEGVAVSAGVTGLDPATSYRFRVVAENECDAISCVDEEEASFSTYPVEEGLLPCPNDALRHGLSARLPDCRAYELVTPPDTNGRAPRGVGFVSARFLTFGASPAGDSVSFLTEGGALPGEEGAGGLNGDRYLATRGPEGWTNVSAGPSGSESETPSPGSASADQGHSFWETGSFLDEGSAVIDDAETAYVRYPDGRSELIGRGSLGTDPDVEGNYIAPGGIHIIFTTSGEASRVPKQLELQAPPTGTEAIYDRTADEVTHVVSLLPGDLTPAAGEDAKYEGVSADGTGIAFRIGAKLYLRYENEETFELGEGTAFAGMADDGDRAFYVKGGELFAFDVETGATIPFSSSGDVTVVNVAGGGTRAYFVSPSVLTEEANPNGATAQVGKENLYLSEEGAISFVGTLTAIDVAGEDRGNGLVVGLGRWMSKVGKGELAQDPSRTTPDGSSLLFEARAQLTAAPTGGRIQVYRYDSGDERLHCLTCLPTGAVPTSDASLQSIAATQDAPAPASSFGLVPNLRADGDRAFFQTSEPLVVRDTDGLQDVYEWEEQGVGSCGRSGGCVYLVSSGHSARDDYLYGNSLTGDDVFFITSDVLTPEDANGTPSIYDARVLGGFAQHSTPTCLPEECRGQLSPPPALPQPASGTTGPSSNLPPPKSKKCPKGKRKVKRQGKVRCVKKRQVRRSGKKGGAR
jgi:DNA-binding beta-propeller fold protein YncE